MKKGIVILFIVALLTVLVIFRKALPITGQQPAIISSPASMQITTTAFSSNGPIPARYTCSGAGERPELQLSGIPKEAKTITLIIDDPDVPTGTFTHWTVWNIDPPVAVLGAVLPSGSTQGMNGAKKLGYISPCPPPGKVHHYHFTAYALDISLSLSSGSEVQMLRQAMDGHIVATAEIIGTFGR